jgi:hypothetical protein
LNSVRIMEILAVRITTGLSQEGLTDATWPHSRRIRRISGTKRLTAAAS